MPETHREVLVIEMKRLFGFNDAQAERLAEALMLAVQEDFEKGWKQSALLNPPTTE